MKNQVILNSLRNHFFISFSMLEEIIEICPEGLWNSKKSGFVFWQQLLHTFAGMLFWLREEDTDFTEPFNEKKVYPELEHDPETMLTKDEIKNCCMEAKETAKKWFNEKDDKWLKSESKINNRLTNFDIMIMQVKHTLYHIGHCEAVFRENGIETGEYLDYIGEAPK